MKGSEGIEDADSGDGSASIAGVSPPGARFGRTFTRLIPSITQASLIGSALIVSYGYPLLFGLAIYGAFAAATALTFITQRVVDLIAESTLAERDPLNLVKSSLLVAGTALALLVVLRSTIPAMAAVPFDYALFVSLLLSTIVLNLCFQIGTPLTQLLYAVMFGGLNFSVTLAWYLSGRTDLTFALTITNLLGFGAGAVLLALDHRRAKSAAAAPNLATTATMLRQLPFRIMFAAFQIVVTFGAVLIASTHLPADQIGALRLLTTFAMLGYSLSPVNPKMLYAASRDVERPGDFINILRPYAPVFGALGAGWLVAAFLVGWWGIASHGHVYLFALALYPVVLFGALFEKVLLNRNGIRVVGLTGGLWAVVVATALFFGSQLEYYAMVLIGGVAAYPLVLSALLSRRFIPMAIGALVLVMFGLALIGAYWLAAAIIGIAAIGMGMTLSRVSKWTR